MSVTYCRLLNPLSMLGVGVTLFMFVMTSPSVFTVPLKTQWVNRLWDKVSKPQIKVGMLQMSWIVGRRQPVSQLPNLPKTFLRSCSYLTLYITQINQWTGNTWQSKDIFGSLRNCNRSEDANWVGGLSMATLQSTSECGLNSELGSQATSTLLRFKLRFSCVLVWTRWNWEV